MIIPSIVILLTLCGRRNKQSQSSRETDDSETNSNLARVNLTHTLGTSKDRSEATVCLSFGSWNRATTSDCRTVRTPIVQDIRL
jgi:hypothetical protein